MGGQLSAMAPTQIHPVEYYLADLGNTEFISFDMNLGSTRFFKVARVKLHQARPLMAITGSSKSSSNLNQFLNYTGFGAPSLGVAKVFVINDPSLPLKSYKEVLIRLKESLESNPNGLPFNRIILSDKCGILLRQYIKYNLYDRLSTRPYLTSFEKIWITFQLLKSFQWCHQRGIYHGDLKLENILITSFHWILLTDFAPFKPTRVPEDNPSDFSFYFDTSRRRCCNLAPERFVLSDERVVLSEENVPTNDQSVDELKPQMDLFSLGCVLAELFADSSDFFLFDLSSILLYKKDGSMTWDLNQVIGDESIRALIQNLIQVDPDLRYSTTQHLKAMTPGVFPSYFSLIYDYFKQLMNYSSDGKIIKLRKDLPTLIDTMASEDSNGFILLLVQLTSTLRSLKHINAKITCLRLIQSVVEADPSVTSKLVIDRVVPYLLAMAKDPCPRVRAESVNVLTATMAFVQEVPPSDANVFTDYILPLLNKIVSDHGSMASGHGSMASGHRSVASGHGSVASGHGSSVDKSVLVKLSIASNLAPLSDVASRILSQHKSIISESEEKLLKESFALTISSLLTDRSNSVKRHFLQSNVSKLAVFLGKAKANDVILSHIITFLNDKSDAELRGAFFDHIVSIVGVLGETTSSILKPLLSQGLVDTSESVIVKAINAICCLSQLSILDKSTMFDLIGESVPFLFHPSPWIFTAQISLLVSFGAKLSLPEMNCKLLPIVNKFTRKKIHILTPDLLFDTIKAPISRNSFNLLISLHTPIDQLESLFTDLENKQLMAALPPHSRRSFAVGSSSSSGCILYQRIVAEEGVETLSPELEEKLYTMANLISRINRNMKSSIKRCQSLSSPDGSSSVVELELRRSRRLNSTNLIDEEKMIKTRIRSMTSDMNNEWRQMFGSIGVSSSSNEGVSSRDGDSMEGIIIAVGSEARESEEMVSEGIKCPPCVSEVKELIDHKKDEYELYLWSRGVDGSTCGSPCDPRTGYIVNNSQWRPKRCLVGHLFEHTKGVNQLTVIQGTPLFASASSDGYIKVWESHKIDSGSMPVNKSRQSLPSNDLSGFQGLTYCAAVDSLVAFTSNSNLHLFKVDLGSTRLKQMEVKGCDTSDKFITDLSTSSAFSVITSSSDSTLSGHDLRMGLNSLSWHLHTDLKHGFISSISASDYSLFAATSSGLIYTFDTRFLINSLRTHPQHKRIRRLLFTPGPNPTLYAAVKGNNEVSVYDPESGVRSKVFWASKVPILSESDATSDSVLSMVSISNGSSNALLTAGTDMRIRYWDLDNIERSYVMSDGYQATSSYSRTSLFSYETKITDGIEVFQESIKSGHPENGTNDPNLVSPAHRDAITDMVWVESSKVLVSSSMDGVIKVWK